jgi:uncharacterized small protein (DUF1192 family)
MHPQRKPIGLSIPHRKVEQDKADKLKILQEQVQELTKRVVRLEKEIDRQRNN